MTTRAEQLTAAKDRAWEVIRQWRHKPMCDDETLAAMVAKVVLEEAINRAEIEWLCRVEYIFGRCTGQRRRGYLSREAEKHDHSRCGEYMVIRKDALEGTE